MLCHSGIRPFMRQYIALICCSKETFGHRFEMNRGGYKPCTPLSKPYWSIGTKGTRKKLFLIKTCNENQWALLSYSIVIISSSSNSMRKLRRTVLNALVFRNSMAKFLSHNAIDPLIRQRWENLMNSSLLTNKIDKSNAKRRHLFAFFMFDIVFFYSICMVVETK